MSEEKCMRCGEVGEDRRTIHMACFYALEEMGIPLEEEVLFFAGEEAQFKQIEAPAIIDLPGPEGKKIALSSGTVTTDAELVPQKQYTIRVCKDCRADWMVFMKAWWAARGASKKSTGTGAFIRENGTTREMTQEEVDMFIAAKGHPPVTVKDIDAEDGA